MSELGNFRASNRTGFSLLPELTKSINDKYIKTQPRPTSGEPVDLIHDYDWINNKILGGEDNFEEYGDLILTMKTGDNELHFGDSVIGGSKALNAKPQHTRYADLRTSGLTNKDIPTLFNPYGNFGYGRSYTETYIRNNHVIYMRFGDPEFSGLALFLRNFMSPEARYWATEGHGVPPAYRLGQVLGSIASFRALGLKMFAIGHASTAALNALASVKNKYYYIDYKMIQYWNMVEVILNKITTALNFDETEPDKNVQNIRRLGAAHSISSNNKEIMKAMSGITVAATGQLNVAKIVGRYHIAHRKMLKVLLDDMKKNEATPENSKLSKLRLGNRAVYDEIANSEDGGTIVPKVMALSGVSIMKPAESADTLLKYYANTDIKAVNHGLNELTDRYITSIEAAYKSFDKSMGGELSAAHAQAVKGVSGAVEAVSDFTKGDTFRKIPSVVSMVYGDIVKSLSSGVTDGIPEGMLSADTIDGVDSLYQSAKGALKKMEESAKATNSGPYVFNKEGIFEGITSGVGKAASDLIKSIGEAEMSIGEYGLDYLVLEVDQPSSPSDSFSNSTTSSPVADFINSKAKIGRQAKYSFSGYSTGIGIIDTMVKTGMDALKGTANGVTWGFTNVIENIVAGVQVDIPDNYDSSDYTPTSTSYTISLNSPYPHPYAQVQNIYLPLACIIAAVGTRSVGNNTSAPPFLCNLFSQGETSIATGIISSVSLERATSNLGQDKDKRPLAMKLSFTVENMATNMAIPLSHPSTGYFGFSGNNSEDLDRFIDGLTGVSIQMAQDHAFLSSKYKVASANVNKNISTIKRKAIYNLSDVLAIPRSLFAAYIK